MHNFVERFGGGKTIVILLALLLVESAILLAMTMPENSLQLITELQVEGSAEVFAERWAAATPVQREAVLNHYYVDFLYPLTYSLFACFLLAWLWPRALSNAAPSFLLAGTLVMGCLDGLENILQLLMYSDTVAISQGLVTVASTAATVKWGLAAVFSGLATLLAMLLLVKSFSKK